MKSQQSDSLRKFFNSKEQGSEVYKSQTIATLELDELDAPERNLKFESRREEGDTLITLVTNMAHESFEFAVLQVCLYDADNVRVGTRLSVFGDFTSGEIWKMSIPNIPATIVRVEPCIIFAQRYKDTDSIGVVEKPTK